MRKLSARIFYLASSLLTGAAHAGDVKEGELAPDFTLQTHENKAFKLSDRKGHGWTVLYFFPKADTPGCTKQACAFRDSIQAIRDKKAEVFGISTDSVEDAAAFHKKYHLSFPLLADPDAKVTDLYGARMPILKIAKRWTFLIDSDLRIRRIEKNVDPVKDPQSTVKAITELSAK